MILEAFAKRSIIRSAGYTVIELLETINGPIDGEKPRRGATQRKRFRLQLPVDRRVHHMYMYRRFLCPNNDPFFARFTNSVQKEKEMRLVGEALESVTTEALLPEALFVQVSFH